MTLCRLIGSLLLIGATFSNGFSEELEFTGSHWDTADSYRLLIDFEKSPARLEWDGYLDNHMGRKKDAPGRIRFGFKLSKEETSLLQSLKDGLPLCHNGHQMTPGTGLSNTVRTWDNGKLKSEQFYFHVEPNAVLGQRMSSLPLSFQEKVANEILPEPQRAEWFNEISKVVAIINSWREALSDLTSAQNNRTEIPWPTILATSAAAWDFGIAEAFENEWAFAYEAGPVIDLLLSRKNRSEYFPELGAGPVIVRIDEIYKNELDEWYSTSPPCKLGSGSDEWKLAPPAFLRLIEDFISVKGGRFGGLHQHGLLDLVKPNEGHQEDYLKRLEFIESSSWTNALTTGKNKNQPTSQLRIFTITFEEKMSKCVVLTHRDDEACFTLLQVEEAKWKILRQLDSADWDDYGWKEPPFK